MEVNISKKEDKERKIYLIQSNTVSTLWALEYLLKYVIHLFRSNAFFCNSLYVYYKQSIINREMQIQSQ